MTRDSVRVMSEPDATIRVVLEVGRTWVFAAALDWPGWCRRGRDEPRALDALLDYADRYRAVAGPAFTAGEPRVVGRAAGTATTDFGAPDVAFEQDREPLDPAEADRLAGLVAAAWTAFDDVVAKAPPALRRGPRGGGRDRDAMAAHVREAERAYARKIGVRLPPRTPWPAQRDAVLAALRAGAPDSAWPARYALRRVAWHVLDHAWEIEDKSD
jgi:hypothetical protein